MSSGHLDLFDYDGILSAERKEIARVSMPTARQLKCTPDYLSCRALAKWMVMWSPRLAQE